MARGYKTGGRERGTPNKTTQELREMIENFINENFDVIKQDFTKLDPKDRMKIYVDILQFILPKVQAIHMDTSEPERPFFDLNESNRKRFGNDYSSNSQTIFDMNASLSREKIEKTEL